MPSDSLPVVGVFALVCDLDGVLRHFDARELAQVELEAGLESGTVTRLAFDPALLLPAITGTISDEQWRDSVVESLSRAVPAPDARRIVARWSASPGRIDPEVLGLLQRVRARALVVLLTNATTRLDADLGALGVGVGPDVDAVVSSAVTGAAEPAAQAFRAAQSVVSVLLGRSVVESNLLLVDDDYRNVEAAAELGWNAVQFSDTAALARSLAAHGLI